MRTQVESQWRLHGSPHFADTHNKQMDYVCAEIVFIISFVMTSLNDIIKISIKNTDQSKAYMQNYIVHQKELEPKHAHAQCSHLIFCHLIELWQ